jgi:hypothetical protein
LLVLFLVLTFLVVAFSLQVLAHTAMDSRLALAGAGIIEGALAFSGGTASREQLCANH